MQSITYKTNNFSIQLFKNNFNFVHFEEKIWVTAAYLYAIRLDWQGFRDVIRFD